MASHTDFAHETSQYPEAVRETHEFWDLTEEEYAALDRLDRKEPMTISVEKELRDCIKNGEIWRDHKRQNRQRLRDNLAHIYGLWSHFVTNEDSRRVLLKACDRRKIQITARTDVLLALIHLCLRPGDDAAYRYASALRESALQGVSAGKLASHLAKKGCGVNAMAEAFRERRRPKNEDKPADESSVKTSTSSDSNSRSRRTTLVDSADKNIPKLQWEDSALAKWQLNNKSKVYLVVECNGQMAGIIVRVRTSLRKKPTGQKASSSRAI
jgi:hypothetical protein